MTPFEIQLFTSNTPAMGNVNAISQKMEWVKIPIAVDSGATANATPNDIFSVEIIPTSEHSENTFRWCRRRSDQTSWEANSQRDV